MSFKEQLKDEILPKAVEYYNAGTGINEAIVKAAQDFKLNLDQTDRLLETMNTARVIAHYEKNASDRTSDCDIADKDTVRRLLYAGEPAEKAASAPSGSAWGDYASYMEPEANYRARSRMEKAASVSEPAEPQSEFTVKQAADHVMDYARKVEGQRRFAEERVAMAEACIATNLSKIAHDLSSGYEPERRYALFKAACLKACPEVVKSVDSEIPPHVIKDAAPHFRAINRANVLDTASVDAISGFAADVEDDIRKVAEMRSTVDSLRAHEDEVKDVIRRYAGAVKSAATRGPGTKGKEDKKDDDKGPSKADDPWLGSVAKSTAKSIAGLVPQPSPGVKNIYDYLTGAAMTPEKLDEAVQGDKKKGTSLKDYVNNMRRSDIISELYAEDPIISEASPEDVSRAYQTLVQAAPEASLNKEVVRAVLRQSINSVAVSPFDAKQWADLDNSLLKNKGMDSGRKATA